MSYINREDLLATINEVWERKYERSNDKVLYDLYRMIIRRINRAPEADAVKLTRCKDCDYCHEYTKWNGQDYLGCNRLAEFCDGQIVEVDAYDFCSYMNRRNKDD